MTSSLTAIERIARVLAGLQHSTNAEGEDASAALIVEDAWHDHVDDAIAILKTLREPDPVMSAAGDPDMWQAMVEAALDAEQRTFKTRL
jgi:hypothetical protein